MCARQYMMVVGLVSGLCANGTFVPICNKVSLKHKCLTFLALFTKCQRRATTPTYPQLAAVRKSNENAKTTERRERTQRNKQDEERKKKNAKEKVDENNL